MQTLNPAYPHGAGPAGFSLVDALAAIRRRTRPMVVTFGAVLTIAVLAAILWPPTYRSTGTILIEQQEVPTEFVRSAVMSYADQRVQVISQRVMTSANLLGIIEKYKLYGDARDTSTREELTERMRRDIQLQMISADVMDPRQGRATKATIAFSVSYNSRSPVMAARVANELTTLYLSENIESRKQLAASTADFLRDESERLGRSVAVLEAKVATFKEKNGERLPEYQLFNMQSLDRSQLEQRDLQARIRSLDQQITFLDAQLAQIDPNGVLVSENGDRILSSRDRLKALRSQLASAEALYSEDHPDVRRFRREVAGLEAQLGGGTVEDSNALARRLTTARSDLSVAQERYGDEHPDVVRLKREVAGLEQSLATSSTAPPRSRDAGADNPAYITLRSQKNAAVNERVSLQTQVGQVRARIAELEHMQAAAPGVEGEYSALARDLSNEKDKYAETRQKQMEAQLVQNLETERKGERFTLIEPPLQPTRPVSPNRTLLLVLGLVLAGGTAFALMYLLEHVDMRIRDRSHLMLLVGIPPLAIVPLVELEEERHARSLLRRKVLIATGVGIAVLLVLVQLFGPPLDALWFGLMRRFGI
jgi:uncharacterized protein involved in exopolysaccharide biosynthesis